MTSMLRDVTAPGMAIVEAVTASQNGTSLAAAPAPASNGIDANSYQDKFESVGAVATCVVALATASTALSFKLEIKGSANSDMSSAEVLKTVEDVEMSAAGTVSVFASVDLAKFNSVSTLRYFNAVLTPTDTGSTSADADETFTADLVLVAGNARMPEEPGQGYIVL